MFYSAYRICYYKEVSEAVEGEINSSKNSYSGFADLVREKGPRLNIKSDAQYPRTVNNNIQRALCDIAGYSFYSRQTRSNRLTGFFSRVFSLFHPISYHVSLMKDLV